MNEGQETIEPGTYGLLTGELSTKNHIGGKRVRVVVESNDPRAPETELWVTLIVDAPLIMSDDKIDFGTLSRSSETIHKLELAAFDGENSEFEVVDAMAVDSERFSVSTRVTASRRQYEITVSVLPGAPAGEARSFITIYTSNPRFDVIKVPVYATIISE
jgi:hypothetical protein